MHLPRLRAWLPDDRAAARLLETAIRHEQRVVPLVTPPLQAGPHVLEVPHGNGLVVCVIAEPVGLGRPDGVPMELRPLDPVQMPDLFALVERLDNPSAVAPAPPAAPQPAPAAPARAHPPPAAAPVFDVPHVPHVPYGPRVPHAPLATAVPRAAPTPLAARPAAPRQRASSQAASSPAVAAPEAATHPASAKWPASRPAGDPNALSVPSPDLLDYLGEPEHEPAHEIDVDVDVDDFVEALPDSTYGGDDAPTLFQKPARETTDQDTTNQDTLRPPHADDDERLEATITQTSGLLGAPSPEAPGAGADFPEQTLILPASQGGAHPAGRELPAAPRPAAGVPAKPQSVTSKSLDLSGKTIGGGKYAIERSLGRGLTAVVYRAMHTSLNRPVAVKVLHQENRGNPQFVKRFRAEGRTLSRLEHQNISRVLDFGEEADGILYLVMELLDGESVEVLLRKGRTFTQRQIVDLGIQTCSGLAFAHDVGVIHRDVKPDNIVLVPHRDDDGRPCELVKVCDFGLAKLRTGADQEAGGAGGAGGEGELTMAGALCGSPAYMSPEQLLGEPLDARSDIYGLGVTLYEALSGGKFPHEGEGLTDLFVKKLTGPPAPLRDQVRGVDPALDAAIMRALAREKTDRHADARAFRQELRAVLARL